MNYTPLKPELANDPQALGLVAASDQAAADLLNTVRQGAAYQLVHAPITAQQLNANLDPTEFAALTQIQLLRLQIIMFGSPIDLRDASTRANLSAIFPANGATRTALA